MRAEIVTEWLAGVDRQPSTPSSQATRTLGAMVPITVGGALGMAMFAVLTLVLTSIVISRQWTDAQQAAVTARPVAESTDAAQAIRTAARAGRMTPPSSFVPDGARMMAHTTLSAKPRQTPTLPLASDRVSLWRDLPGTLPAQVRATLEAEPEDSTLLAFRSIAYGGERETFDALAQDLSAASDPYTDLPVLSQAELLQLALRNEDAALLAMADGDRATALRRAREDIGVGVKLWRDPINGWIGSDVMAIGARMLNEIGLIDGSRELILEAQRVEHAIGAGTRGVGAARMRGLAALMVPLANPPGLEVVRDQDRFAYQRWWALAGIAPAFCGNPREILFGVDRRRADLLQRAAEMVQDIPSSADWIGLNDRALLQWIHAPGRRNVTLSTYLVPLRWVGLSGLANRIAYCRGQ
jgi:hypothetical protein